MKSSESIKELATALSKAQGAMKGAVKDSSNPFFKSKYADLASVVEAIREPFMENGLSYIQTVEPSTKNEVQVETTILHSSGEWVSCGFLALPVSKDDAQGFGSALTYARRYSLSIAVGVAPEDDDGNGATKAAPQKEDYRPEAKAGEWDVPSLSEFEGILDRAYKTYKATNTVEAYNKFASEWKVAQKFNPPKETLERLEKAVKKLEAAAEKKQAEALGKAS